MMTLFRGRHESGPRRQPAEHAERLPEIEGEIRKLVRRDFPQAVRAETGSRGMSDFKSLAQSISGPVLEIERVIAELQELRDCLTNKGQRIQREITEYAHMGQAAVASTKIIAESLAQWKQTAESDRAVRARAPASQVRDERSESAAVDGPPMQATSPIQATDR